MDIGLLNRNRDKYIKISNKELIVTTKEKSKGLDFKPLGEVVEDWKCGYVDSKTLLAIINILKRSSNGS